VISCCTFIQWWKMKQYSIWSLCIISSRPEKDCWIPFCKGDLNVHTMFNLSRYPGEFETIFCVEPFQFLLFDLFVANSWKYAFCVCAMLICGRFCPFSWFLLTCIKNQKLKAIFAESEWDCKIRSHSRDKLDSLSPCYENVIYWQWWRRFQYCDKNHLFI